MIAVIATLRIKIGKAQEFESLFGQLAAQVRANESGNLIYHLCRSRTETDTYKVLEIYRDEEALEAHRASDHFRSAGPGLGSVLAGLRHSGWTGLSRYTIASCWHGHAAVPIGLGRWCNPMRARSSTSA